jgi:hypothetical protein
MVPVGLWNIKLPFFMYKNPTPSVVSPGVGA